MYVTDSIALTDVPWLVSPVFITDAVHLLDVAYLMFGDIEIIDENWAWFDFFAAPPSTPISGSSPYKQTPYALIFAKDHQWFWIITLVPVMDLIIKEAAIKEQSIVADLASFSESDKVQYLGSEDDFLLLRLTGPFDMIRQLDGLNRNDEVTVRIRCNGTTWWQGYVRFLSHGGQPVSVGVNLVMMDIPAKGKAETETRTMIGMFGDCPDQAKYLLILTKGQGWLWHNPLEEIGEEI